MNKQVKLPNMTIIPEAGGQLRFYGLRLADVD